MQDIDTHRSVRAASPGPRRALAATFAVALLTAGVVTSFVVASHRSGRDAAAPSAPDPTSSPTAEVVAAPPQPQATQCFESTDNPHCLRYIADLGRRVPVPASRREAVDLLRVQIESMMPPDRHGPCERIDEFSAACSVEILPPSVRQVRTALGKAGHRTAVIRTARSDDPAPVGSVLVAVPTGRECILLFAEGGASRSWVAGRLPGGRCLDP